ncbi:MAG: phosphodiester glycosidase family protein [Clostridia bacterium]|nr:phosphodiester glycosidase family protein [Clostridia bacterium]
MSSKKRTPLWVLLLTDLILCGIGLCVFCYFHHIRTLWNLGGNPIVENEILTPSRPTTPSLPPQNTDTDTYTGTDSFIASSSDSEQTDPSETVDEGQFGEKFSDRFARTPEQVVSSADRYISWDLDLTLTTHVFDGEAVPVNYYVMDIYVRNIENLYTSASMSERNYFTHMVTESGCVLAVSGDYCGNDQAAYEVIRNGVELRESDYVIHDVCVLDQEGNLSVYTPENYNREEIMAKNPYQIWNFGPILVENGINKTNFLKNYDIGGLNPRVAIGEIEPGHYIFIVVDGKNPTGIKLSALARIMKNLGCVTAYNMDGGASAHGYFNGTMVRNGHGGEDPRKLFDIICIGEVAQ